MKLGFIGFGEAASSMALGFSQEGFSDLYAYDALYDREEFRQQVVKKIESTGASLCTSLEDLAGACDVFFAAVPANFAGEVAAMIAPFLKENMLYIDVTTASPVEKHEISNILSSRGVLFVDSAMMGSLPKEKHQVPMLISGEGTDRMLTVFDGFHMNLTPINSVPGAATSIKYVRSIITKGLACLLIEALQLSSKYQVEEIVMNSISESLDSIPFNDTINRYVSGTLVHSQRRTHEMDNVLAALEEAGIPSIMTKAVREKLSWVTSCEFPSQFDAGVPSDWKAIVDRWQLPENQ